MRLIFLVIILVITTLIGCESYRQDEILLNYPESDTSICNIAEKARLLITEGKLDSAILF